MLMSSIVWFFIIVVSVAAVCAVLWAIETGGHAVARFMDKGWWGFLFGIPIICVGLLVAVLGGFWGGIGIIILLVGLAECWYNGICVLRKSK
jgi:hypothetical protein